MFESDSLSRKCGEARRASQMHPAPENPPDPGPRHLSMPPLSFTHAGYKGTRITARWYFILREAAVRVGLGLLPERAPTPAHIDSHPPLERPLADHCRASEIVLVLELAHLAYIVESRSETRLLYGLGVIEERGWPAAAFLWGGSSGIPSRSGNCGSPDHHRRRREISGG